MQVWLISIQEALCTIEEHTHRLSLAPLHGASVLGSTPSFEAAAFCVNPKDSLWRTSRSPKAVGSGSGLYPRNSMVAGMNRSSGATVFASQLKIVVV